MRASNDAGEMATRLAMMDTAGVDVQVLSAAPQVPLVADPGDAAEAARMVNDIYAQILTDHPDCFLAYGAIPLNHPDQALEEVSYCLDELGFVGVAVNMCIGSLRSHQVTISSSRP